MDVANNGIHSDQTLKFFVKSRFDGGILFISSVPKPLIVYYCHC